MDGTLWTACCLVAEIMRPVQRLSAKSSGGLMFRRVALLALAASACCSAAMAQLVTPSSVQANVLGQMEFCQAQGFSGPEAVDAQRKMVSRMSSTGGSVGTGEELGRQGQMIRLDGGTRTIAQLAAIKHSTVQEYCKEKSESVIRNAHGMMRR